MNRVVQAAVAALGASALAVAAHIWVSKASLPPTEGFTIYSDPVYATRLSDEITVAAVWFGAMLAIIWWYALPRISEPRLIYIVLGWAAILGLTWQFGEILAFFNFCC